jgi:tetratricopeptide (TPR) repeat protein
MRFSKYRIGFSSALLLTSILAGCATTSGTRIDNIPMYGQPGIQRSDELKLSDDDFIKKASEGLGERKKASQVWWVQGDQFMAQGNLDFAMRRYNQSWLLNPKNYQPYWGFSRVLIEQGKIDEALIHLSTANQLVDNDYQKVALLADTATAYSVKANRISADNPKERDNFFGLANQYFLESTQLDPAYQNAYRRWARSLFLEGRFADAWEKVRKARSLGGPDFPPQFIKALEEKMPAPK